MKKLLKTLLDKLLKKLVKKLSEEMPGETLKDKPVETPGKTIRDTPEAFLEFPRETSAPGETVEEILLQKFLENNLLEQLHRKVY